MNTPFEQTRFDNPYKSLPLTHRQPRHHAQHPRSQDTRRPNTRWDNSIATEPGMGKRKIAITDEVHKPTGAYRTSAGDPTNSESPFSLRTRRATDSAAGRPGGEPSQGHFSPPVLAGEGGATGPGSTFDLSIRCKRGTTAVLVAASWVSRLTRLASIPGARRSTERTVGRNTRSRWPGGDTACPRKPPVRCKG